MKFLVFRFTGECSVPHGVVRFRRLLLVNADSHRTYSGRNRHGWNGNAGRCLLQWRSVVALRHRRPMVDDLWLIQCLKRSYSETGEAASIRLDNDVVDITGVSLREAAWLIET